jgi:hypothetical protein
MDVGAGDIVSSFFVSFGSYTLLLIIGRTWSAGNMFVCN